MIRYANYVVVEALTKEELERRVNRHLEAGWSVVPPLQVTMNGLYIQVMIMEVPSWEEK